MLLLRGASCHFVFTSVPLANAGRHPTTSKQCRIDEVCGAKTFPKSLVYIMGIWKEVSVVYRQRPVDTRLTTTWDPKGCQVEWLCLCNLSVVIVVVTIKPANIRHKDVFVLVSQLLNIWMVMISEQCPIQYLHRYVQYGFVTVMKVWCKSSVLGVNSWCWSWCVVFSRQNTALVSSITEKTSQIPTFFLVCGYI